MDGLTVDAMLALSVLLFVVLGTLVVMALAMPFFVSLTRLRANYLPKAVSLNNVLSDGLEDDLERRSIVHSVLMRARRATAKIGPVVDGVIPMIKRTKRLEGWRGLYRGSTILTVGLMTQFVLTNTFFSLDASDTTVFATSTLAMFLWEVVGALVVLPFDVVLKRYVSLLTVGQWSIPGN